MEAADALPKNNNVMKWNLWSVVLAGIWCSGCASHEIGASRDVAQERIYLQYEFDFSEARRVGEFSGQFRFGGSNGTTLVLSSPSQIQWNGETLQVDSLPSAGAFYRKSLGADAWWGTHTLSFTDTQGKLYENRVTLQRPIVQVLRENATTSKGLELDFQLTGAVPDDELEVYSVDTDSSFRYRFRLDADGATTLFIPAKEINRQQKGTISLGFQLNQIRSLAQAPVEGGEVRLAYTLACITFPITKK
jgi:hypothetical protein